MRKLLRCLFHRHRRSVSSLRRNKTTRDSARRIPNSPWSQTDVNGEVRSTGGPSTVTDSSRDTRKEVVTPSIFDGKETFDGRRRPKGRNHPTSTPQVRHSRVPQDVVGLARLLLLPFFPPFTVGADAGLQSFRSLEDRLPHPWGRPQSLGPDRHTNSFSIHIERNKPTLIMSLTQIVG